MDFVTIGDIAKKVGVDRDAVSYAIRKKNIKPIGRAGIVRLFPNNAVAKVRSYIRGKKKHA